MKTIVQDGKKKFNFSKIFKNGFGYRTYLYISCASWHQNKIVDTDGRFWKRGGKEREIFRANILLSTFPFFPLMSQFG